jgi:hypothetical protein
VVDLTIKQQNTRPTHVASNLGTKSVVILIIFYMTISPHLWKCFKRKEYIFERE